MEVAVTCASPRLSVLVVYCKSTNQTHLTLQCFFPGHSFGDASQAQCSQLPLLAHAAPSATLVSAWFKLEVKDRYCPNTKAIFIYIIFTSVKSCVAENDRGHLVSSAGKFVRTRKMAWDHEKGEPGQATDMSRTFSSSVDTPDVIRDHRSRKRGIE